MATRKFVIDRLDVLDKGKMNAIKDHLKSYFMKLYNPDGPMSETAIKRFLLNNVYSSEKIKKRKQDYEQRAATLEELDKKKTIENSRKSLLTPRQRRKKNSTELVTPIVLRKARRAFAPDQPKGPPAKKVNVDLISTPIKRYNRDSQSTYAKRIRRDKCTAGNDPTATASEM